MSGATTFGYTTIQSYRDCQRKYYWRGVRRVQLKPQHVDAKLRFGVIMHKAIQLFEAVPDPPAAALLAVEMELEESVKAGYDVTKAKEEADKTIGQVLTILYRYQEWLPLPRPEGPWPELVGGASRAEVALSAELLKGFQPITGRPDKIFPDPQHRWWIRDIKTTTWKFDRLFKKYALSDQMVQYVWLCRQNGIPVVGYIIRAIRKLKQPEFRDEPYLVGPAQLTEFERQHYMLLEELAEPRVRDHYRQNREHCFGTYGECPFLRLCPASPLSEKGEQAILEEFYQPIPMEEADGEEEEA